MIDDFFKKHFLTFESIGSVHEIFFNTPTETMPEIINFLQKQSNDNCEIAIVTINKHECSIFDSIFNIFSASDINTPSRINPIYQTRAICLAYIRTKILLGILESCNNITEENTEIIAKLKNILKGFNSEDKNELISSYINSPLDLDIEDEIKKIPRTNIALFESDVNSNLMQSAINNYIGSRTRYSMKVFTNQPRLHNNYDTSGNLVSPIHDYRAIDLDKYLHNEEPTA